MAFTVDKRPTGEKMNAALDRGISEFSQNIDFATVANQLAQNEIMALGTVEIGDTILNAYIKVNTIDADVADLDVGISTDTTTNADLVDGADPSTTTGIKAGVVANFPIVVTAESVIVLTNKDASTVNEADIDVVVLIHKHTP